MKTVPADSTSACCVQEMHMVVPPIKAAARGRPVLAAADWRKLSELADGLIVMTYDASHPGSPGPNAPLPWIRHNLRALLPADEDPQL